MKVNIKYSKGYLYEPFPNDPPDLIVINNNSVFALSYSTHFPPLTLYIKEVTGGIYLPGRYKLKVEKSYSAEGFIYFREEFRELGRVTDFELSPASPGQISYGMIDIEVKVKFPFLAPRDRAKTSYHIWPIRLAKKTLADYEFVVEHFSSAVINGAKGFSNTWSMIPIITTGIEITPSTVIVNGLDANRVPQKVFEELRQIKRNAKQRLKQKYVRP